MINHIDIRVIDLEKTKKFYSSILKPLGYKIKFENEYIVSFSDNISSAPGGDIYFSIGKPTKYHFAFQARNHKQVKEFYEIGMKMGAKDDGEPGYRPYYHENYYACYLIDLEGYPIECVCHN
ncbi:VOC family protein [Miniphocaeibacter massiliensis]|uniref:VOC family protein n=1 Tax=Miniphocaeibacter massiliensis TaxID=2041841 RepID=UPI000C1C821E|nr:VOC family protein [Miniphocaeibacter massiliensis]